MFAVSDKLTNINDTDIKVQANKLCLNDNEL